MIRTLIALGLLFGLAGAALAAPPAVSPPGKRLVVQPDETSPGPMAEAERPDGWTWFGMGFESRRARLAGDDEGSGPGEPWADGPYGTRANVAAGNAARSRRARSSVLPRCFSPAPPVRASSARRPPCTGPGRWSPGRRAACLADRRRRGSRRCRVAPPRARPGSRGTSLPCPVCPRSSGSTSRVAPRPFPPCRSAPKRSRCIPRSKRARLPR